MRLAKSTVLTTVVLALLVVAGLGSVVTGVYVVAGLGPALIAAGTAAVAAGLLADI